MVDPRVLGCTFDGCVFADEGVCARSGETAPCEFAVFAGARTAEGRAELDEVNEVQTDPDGGFDWTDPELPVEQTIFHTGEELGLDEIPPLMAEQYTTLITILGDHDAGKTCFITCVYLMLNSGELDDVGITFAGSLTLKGFEARARNGRKWVRGSIPSKMSRRTNVRDGRGAGFMHLDLADQAGGTRSRLLMSDLPGEWTTSLVDNSRYGERLIFAQRSDAILIMIDGRQLTGAERFTFSEQICMLIDRLSSILGDAPPTLHFVATRADVIGKEIPPALEHIASHARAVGFEADARVISTYANSEDPKAESGHGMVDLIKLLLRRDQNLSAPAASPRPDRLFGWAPISTGDFVE